MARRPTSLAWFWRRTPAFLIAFAIYTVILLPVIGIFHAGPQIAADRYAYLATLPLRRLAAPEEIALTVAFLVEQGTFCVGEVISPNSGAVI